MSFSSVRKKLADQRETPALDSWRCKANGCPGRGTTSHGGEDFFCSAHAHADPMQWPRITERMQEFSWLLEFIDTIKTMDRQHEDWRAFANQFWNEDECKPHEKEAFVPYEFRMRGEVLYRCGIAKRPGIRLPRESKRAGNLGALLSRGAAETARKAA